MAQAIISRLASLLVDEHFTNKLTGETATRERRKRRSATQSAARRWWNTEAIDLSDDQHDHYDVKQDFDYMIIMIMMKTSNFHVSASLPVIS